MRALAEQAATRRGAFVLFALFAVIFIATASYGYVSTDVRSAFLPAWSLGQNGTINSDGYLTFGAFLTEIDGHVRSDRFPGVILAAVPAYALYALFGGSPVPIVGPSAVTAALIAAGSVMVMHRTLLRTVTPGLALGGTLVFGLGTSTWSLSGDALWTHTVTQFGLCLVLYALASHRSSWAVVGMLMATASRPHAASIALVLAAGLIWQGGRRREVAALASGTALGLMVVLVWTSVTLGGATLLPGSYQGRGSNAVAALDGGPDATNFLIDLFIKIDGYLLSSQRGLLILTPIIALALIQLPRAWRRAPHWCKGAALAAVLYSLIQLVGNTFSGGTAFYSYRLAIEAMTLLTPLVVVCAGIAAARSKAWRIAAFAALAYGFAVQGLGAVWYANVVETAGPWRVFQPLDVARTAPAGAWLAMVFGVGLTALVGALVRSDEAYATSLATAFRRHARRRSIVMPGADVSGAVQPVVPREQRPAVHARRRPTGGVPSFPMPRVSGVALAAAASIGVLGGLVRWLGPGPRASADSYWYVSNAFAWAGVPEDVARETAQSIVCSNRNDASLVADCPRLFEELATYPERYQAIFDSRPGYSALLAPLVGGFGPSAITVTALITMALLALVLSTTVVRWLSLGDRVGRSQFTIAAVTSVIAVALPLGFWTTRVMSEGTSYVLLAAAALVACGVIGGQVSSRLGGTLLFVCTFLACAVKSSYGTVLAVGLTAMFVGLSLTKQGRGRVELRAAAAASAGAGALWAVLSAAFSWPGIGTTLQDKFTAHFTRPDVADPVSRLFDLQRSALTEWFADPGFRWASLAMIAAAFGYLLYRVGVQALPWLLVGLIGPINVVVHPVMTEVPRLQASVWLPVTLAVSLALLSPRVVKRRRDDESTPAPPRILDLTAREVTSAEVFGEPVVLPEYVRS